MFVLCVLLVLLVLRTKLFHIFTIDTIYTVELGSAGLTATREDYSIKLQLHI